MHKLMALVLANALRSSAALRSVARRIRATSALRASTDEWALPPGWAAALADETASARHKELRAFVASERETRTIYPPPDDTLAALRAVDLEDVEVVIVGQDPYHGPGQAHGLCFSIQDLSSCTFPPSLRNVLKEARWATAAWPEDPDPAKRGVLGHWSRSGVLLLNSVLTVRQGDANSHKQRGWEAFTDAVLQAVAERERGAVFALWGNAAKRKVDTLGAQHRVVSNSHPSPLAAARSTDAFTGSDCFLTINGHLVDIGRRPIDWRLHVAGEADAAASEAEANSAPLLADDAAAFAAQLDALFAEDDDDDADALESTSKAEADSEALAGVEGTADSEAAALLADVFSGVAQEDAEETAAVPTCGWPAFDASLARLRDAAPADAPVPARDAGERFAALVRILVAPRTQGAFVDAAVGALQPTTAVEFASRAPDDVEAALRAGEVAFPRRKAEFLVKCAEVCALEFAGDVPRRPRDMRRRLPGVGEKGAAQLCASAWGCDDGGIVVGTKTHRACNALGWVETTTPGKTKRALESWLSRAARKSNFHSHAIDDASHRLICAQAARSLAPAAGSGRGARRGTGTGRVRTAPRARCQRVPPAGPPRPRRGCGRLSSH